MSELGASILSTISDVTGRDVDELSGDMTLQEDLGIDSLKIMSLWQSVLSLLPSGVQVDQQALISITRLDELIAAVVDLSNAEVIVDTRSAYVSEVDPGGSRIALSGSQQFFLVSHQLVESTSLCSMVELDKPVDRDRLLQAWNLLIARHINLQTVFYVPPAATRLSEIEYRLLTPKLQKQIRDVDLSGSEDAIGALDDVFHEQLNRTWDLRCWPLHEVSTVSMPGKRSAVLISNEHIISDGLGNQQLLADLMALYNDPDESLPEVLAGQAYTKCINAMNDYSDDSEIEAYQQYASSTAGIQSLWDPQGVVGKQRSAVFKNLRTEFDTDTTVTLVQKAKTLNVSLYALLLASLVQCMRERDDSYQSDKGGVLQIPTAGTLYPGIEIKHTVGCFAQNLSLLVNDHCDQSTSMLAKSINRGIQQALIHGYDRSQSALMAGAMADDFPLINGLIPVNLLDQAQSSLRGNLYVPFTGTTQLPASAAGALLSGYRAATKNVAGTVDILHEINQGRLCLFINYDQNCFSDEDIACLHGDHLQRLQQLSGSHKLVELPGSTAQNQRCNVNAICATTLKLQIGQLDSEADLDANLSIDSLSRIRLVNAIVMHLGNRQLASTLIECQSLAAMQSRVDAALQTFDANDVQALETDADNGPIASGLPAVQTSMFDTSLPAIPLRHIENQARRTPILEAVCSLEASLTYAELETAANQLARTLIQSGVKPCDRVAMSCRRGPDMLIAIVGILKSGAAYVPLDTEFPADRVTYIVEHAGCTHWIGHADVLEEKLRDGCVPASVTTVCTMQNALPPSERYTQITRQQWSNDNSAVEVDISPDDLMVVLYTSGSTGRPKGVALNHRGYMNRIDWHQKQFQLQIGERVAQKTSCSFDVSVWELLWPLMCGGVVCSAEKALVTNPWQLVEWLAEQRIAVMHFVPSLFTEFVYSVGMEKLSLPAMRWMVFSGEALSMQTVRSWMVQQDSQIQLANLYGPTEAHIDVTCHVIDKLPSEADLRIPIGSAIDNVTMLILDDQDQLIEDCTQQGELCIAGVQLADGYWNDKGKTDSAFVPNHLASSGIPGERFYRTGDLACWLPGRSIDYRGRLDSQVKFHGYRIELGEIESVVCEHPAINEAAALVVAGESGGADQLKLWYSPDTLPINELRKQLYRKLTSYMLPQQITAMKVLPKNHNGKLDRNALRALPINPSMQSDTTGSSGGVPTETDLASSPTLTGYQPVTATQRALLHRCPGYSPGSSLSRLSYEGELDVDRLCQSMGRVIARHPSLRSCFQREAGQWYQWQVEQPPCFEPLFFDAQTLTDQEFTTQFESIATDIGLGFRVDQWPLMCILIARRAPGRYEIAIVGSVLIGDMVSGGLFGLELWGDYLQVSPVVDVASESSAVVEIPGSASLSEEISQRVQSNGDAMLQWWHEHLGPKPAISGLERDEYLADNRQDSECSISLTLDVGQTRSLNEAINSQRGVSLYELVSAASYREVARQQNSTEVTISHRVNGRNVLPDRIYFDSIDCFAYNFPIRLEVSRDSDVETCARDFKEKFTNAPLKGASYDALGPDLPARYWPESALTSIRLNYLGDIRMPSTGPVKAVAVAGKNRIIPGHWMRSVEIELWISIRDGALTLEGGYSSHLHHESTISHFMEGIVNDLISFTHHHQTRSIRNAA